MPVIRSLSRVLVVLWAGSLWSLIWVAQMLFHMLGDRHLAGTLASRFFSIETYLGLATGLLLLILPGRTRFLLAYVAAALLSINEWLLKPIMNTALAHGKAAGLSFGAWHGVSAVLYLGACCAMLVVVYRQEFR